MPKKRQHFTKPEKRAFVAKVAEKRKAGLSAEQACEDVGITLTQYYAFRHFLNAGPVTKKLGRKPGKKSGVKPAATPEILSFEAPTGLDNRAILIMGTPSIVAEVLRSL